MAKKTQAQKQQNEAVTPAANASTESPKLTPDVRYHLAYTSEGKPCLRSHDGTDVRVYDNREEALNALT